MNFIDIIILGVVEGITEFLPISSTAHLEFTSRILGINQTDFLKSFLIAIQLGAILSVIVIYFRKIFSSREVFLRIAVGFIPTGIIGFVLYRIIKDFLLGNEWIAVAALIVGGIIMLLVEKYTYLKNSPSSQQGIESLSYGDMIKLGIVQSLAVIPGVSRSGAIIVGGMCMGVSRVVVVEAAFLLAIPTMMAATGYDLLKSGAHFTGNEWSLLLVGFITSFVVAYGSVKWLLDYVRHASFTSFAWYRIIAGIFFGLLFVSIF